MIDMEIGEERFYRYVPHDHIIAYLMAGWMIVADLGYPHCVHASLCEWRGGRSAEVK